MKELSMHILDIATNSVRGGASQILISVSEDLYNNEFRFDIQDNGKGIPDEILSTIKNPFTTSRTLRKVGLGIPLLDENCRLCDGYLKIESQVGCGTTLKSMMVYDHIDRPPMGDIVNTIIGLITSNENIDICYRHNYNENNFEVSTKALQEALEDVPLTSISVIQWLKEYLTESIDELRQ
ncbi:ATP-binding protein [Petrocella sp. FN5]|uniref:ATP-binding protein n=1 Tax=Petrocella sp. FN5 TaxID=3032002 RepID=UPI0023DA7B25|nr:ATP-binding protein [Petrocella sp. FN5]MDF1616336.1 ATP-binding protein [Petrocella sp. FN5]